MTEVVEFVRVPGKKVSHLWLPSAVKTEPLVDSRLCYGYLARIRVDREQEHDGIRPRPCPTLDGRYRRLSGL
jgi:hypothetical protein